MYKEEYPQIQHFRIWNPDKEKFEYSGGTPSMISGFFNQTATCHTVHKMPYDRYTGINDKDGKEIYEGDFLSCNWTERDEDRTGEIILVEYRNGGFFPFAERIGGSSGFLYNTELYSKDCEVIGSLYETPELLKHPKFYGRD